MTRRIRRTRATVVAIASAVLFTATLSGTSRPAGAAPQPPVAPGAVPQFDRPPGKDITLLTGDRVRVETGADGKPGVAALTAAPRGSGAPIAFQTLQHGSSLYVVPSDAAALVADHELDLGLFDVAYLAANGYADDATSGVPLIAQYPNATAATALAARADALPASARTRSLLSIHSAAITVEKPHAASFWAAVTSRGSSGALGGGLTRIWLDRKVHVDLDQSVPQIGAPAAWAAGLDGTGVTVATLDSGIDANHPDLAGKVIAQQNFTTDPDTADHLGHGTHVASIIGGTGAASGGKYKGVAPGVKLIVGKVIDDQDYGEDSWIIAGMEWAVQQHVRIVNMSIGGDPTDGTDPMSQALDELSAQYGTLFVVAAGNAGPSAQTVQTPGSADAALTVAAVTKSDTLASFSSRGPRAADRALKPDIGAPGVDIVAARAAGTSMGRPVSDYYTMASGTSMATPHVSGAAAILAEEHPDWTGTQLKNALMSTAHDDGYTAFEQGTGRVDVARAFAQKIDSTGSVDFGDLRHGQTAPVVRTIDYTNDGDTPLTLALHPQFTDYTGKSAPAHLLTLDRATVVVPAHGHASATVTIDPARVGGAGAYQGSIRAADPTGAVRLVTTVGAYAQPATATLTVAVTAPAGATDVSVGRPLVVREDGREDLDDGPVYLSGTSTVLAQGGYMVGNSVTWKDSHGDWNSALPVAPQVDLTRDTTVSFDVNRAREISVATPRPTQTYDAFFGYQRVDAASHWQVSADLHAGYGSQNYWMIPTERRVTEGSFRLYSQHLLGAPPIGMTELAGRSRPLHPRYQGLDPQYPKLDGTRTLQLVYVKHGLPSDLAGVNLHDKIAVLSLDDICPDSCTGDAEDRVQNIATAGAVAVLGFGGAGRSFLAPGRSWPAYPIPTMSLPADEGAALVADLGRGPVAVRADGVAQSPYLYALRFSDDGKVPASLRHELDGHDLYRIDNRVHADEPGTATLQWATREAGDLSTLSDQVATTAAVPQERTEYVGPLTPDVLWQRQILYGTGQREESVDVFDRPGARSETWGAAPYVPGAGRFSSQVRALGSTVQGFGLDPTFCQACRTVDTFTPMTFLTTAQAGHLGDESWYATADQSGNVTYPDELHLYRGSQELPQSIDRVFLGCAFFCIYIPAPTYALDAGPTTYRLTEHHPTQFPGQRYGTTVDTAWTFTSSRATGGPPSGYVCWGNLFMDGDPNAPCRPEHLLYLDYDLGLDLDNTVPAGSTRTVTVSGYHDGLVSPQPALRSLRLSVTFDAGAHWQDIPTLRHSDGSYTATITNSSSASTVSIRARAQDAEGNTIDQTVANAYGLAPRR
ncbi:MAG TPA: S8 family serine peptidase [Jatrophihabitantaceae bacterium]